MKLANQHLFLEFDDQTGSVRQITNSKNRQRHLGDPRGARLAKLIVPTPGHVSRPLYSHEAGRPEMVLAGDTLTMAFPELRDRDGASGVFLTVRVRLPEYSPEAFFSATIRNESVLRVHEMWFPWLGGHRNARGKSPSLATTSKRAGLDIHSAIREAGKSTHTFGHHHMRIGMDPVHLLPMMDLSNKEGGLSYNKYEQRPSPQVLVFENPLQERRDACLTWAWATGVFAEPGQTWESCEYGVGVHEGDWHVTADRLRNWMAGWWKSCDTPPAVRERIGLCHILTHDFAGQPYNEFSDLPDVARDARRFGVRDLMVWDNTASVYYRPDRGDFWEMPPARRRELKKALAEVRADGVSVSSYVNWRLLCEYNSTWERLQPLVQESLFGVGLFGFPCCTMDGGLYGDPGYEMGSHAVCCGADGYRAYANEVLGRTFDLGFDAIAVDQAGEWNYCLSRKHGHASPWEAWQRTYEWYGEVTRTVRKRHPGSYTLAEVPDLYNVQHIDLWWNWMWRDSTWAELAVFRYVMPSMIPVWCIDENQRDVIAEAFAMGSWFAVATRSMTGRLSDAPELALQIKRLARLRKATAPFVAHGQFVDQRGLTLKGGKGFVYLAHKGAAVALANGGPKTRILRGTLDLGVLGIGAPARAVLHAEGAKPAEITLRKRGTMELRGRAPAVRRSSAHHRSRIESSMIKEPHPSEDFPAFHGPGLEGPMGALRELFWQHTLVDGPSMEEFCRQNVRGLRGLEAPQDRRPAAVGPQVAGARAARRLLHDAPGAVLCA